MAVRGALLLLVSYSAEAAMEQLPSFKVSTAAAEAKYPGAGMVNDAKWWAHVGDHVYVAPPSTSGQLSQHVGDYYAALGSESALNDRMRERRVGGHGRWHIFHLPEGPGALPFNRRGDRRSSFSALVQLRAGDVMPATFPKYTPGSTCSVTLGDRYDEMEKSAVDAITPASYLETLQAIVNIKDSHGYNTRSFSSPSGSASAQEFLKRQFQSMGLKNCVQSFSFRGASQANVVAVIPGTSEATITVGAHYDSRPFDGNAPGAEDNGSGLAAMLSVARAYAEQGIKPEKTLYFVAFAGEEPGLLGSDFFAQELKAGNALPRACEMPSARSSGSFMQTHARKRAVEHEAIALDEVGWLTPKYDKATVNLESYDWTQGIMNELACSSHRHNGDALEVVHSSNPFGSDHMSFLERGMKAVLVINGDDEAYPHYHQSSDTIDQVNYEYAARITKMIMGAVTRAAGGANSA